MSVDKLLESLVIFAGHSFILIIHLLEMIESGLVLFLWNAKFVSAKFGSTS